jgi:hypothetical protein
VQCRPGDADERAHIPPQIVQVGVTQQRAELVAVLEPVDDGASPLNCVGGPQAAQRPHRVGLHRQPGAEPARPRVALDQVHPPRPVAQPTVQAQAGDPAADDQYPRASHHLVLLRHDVRCAPT